MYEARENEPARMPIAPDCLRGLQQMLYLRQVRVRIAIVDKRIQIIRRFPDALPPALETQVLGALFAHEIEGLKCVILAIEFRDSRIGLRLVIAKLILALPRPVSGRDKIVPLLEIFERPA